MKRTSQRSRGCVILQASYSRRTRSSCRKPRRTGVSAMAKGGPSATVKALETVVLIDSPPRPCREVIAEIALGQMWFATQAEADEAAAAWERRFMSRLRKQLNEYNAFGRVCVYAFNSSSE